MTVSRVSFDRLENDPINRATKEVYIFDIENTTKLAQRFRATTSPNLIRPIKLEFDTDGNLFLLSHMSEYCDEHHIAYLHKNITSACQKSKVLRRSCNFYMIQCDVSFFLFKFVASK